MQASGRLTLQRSRFRVLGPKTNYSGLGTHYSALALRSWVSGLRSPVFVSPSSVFSPAGFTLLEVLVASAILSMVLAILYSVFSQTLTSTQLAEEQSAQSRAARIVLLRIGDDLQSSLPFAPENARFVGTVSHAQQLPAASLSFVSLSGLPLTNGSHEGDWYEITYEIVPDPRSTLTQQLVRRTRFSPTSFEEPVRRPSQEETFPLLTGVHGLRFSFFDGRVWHEEWGKEQTRTQLPQAVKVELYLTEKRQRATRQKEETVTFSTLVDLPLAKTEAFRPGRTS